ncbi:MAG: YIP1 family protein [Marinospirillum sp.]|uniref:Yip1 family protein n=1 Tax=Marinospirillum sp. TaxID=2183934 RepID=UPI001A0B1BD1|nr:Yip1 family protein [Marinospirillum sp.]MBE0507845.1 YIP1 family protein [Marinospirillum sp.]
MFIQHMWGVLYNPDKEWQKVREEKYSVLEYYTRDLIWMSAIPPFALFVGTTQVGWTIGMGEYIKLTPSSALPIALAFYLALLVGAGLMASIIHWMEKTYSSNASMERCMALTTYTASPLLLAGLAGFWPNLWFVVAVGLIALAYTLYLLYTGVPHIMEIPEEQGFMFSTSIATVGLVMLVGLLTTTVLLWGLGMGPAYMR